MGDEEGELEEPNGAVGLLDRASPETEGRRFRHVGSLIVVVVLLCTVGLMAYLTNYMPLIPAGMWGYGPNECLDEIWSVDAGSHRAPLFEFVCRDGGDFALWGESMTNEGPLPVTVLEIGKPGSSFAPFRPLEVRTYDFARHLGSGDEELDLPDVSRFYEDLDPFQPFTLGVGQQRNIVFRLELRRDCTEEGGRIGLTAIPIKYRVLGIERTEWWVPFNLSMRCSR